MKDRLKYKLHTLIAQKKPKADEVIDVLYNWADRVIPLTTYTVKSFVKKSYFTIDNLTKLRGAMVHGAEKQRVAHRPRHQLEYNDSVEYIERQINVMKQVPKLKNPENGYNRQQAHMGTIPYLMRTQPVLSNIDAIVTNIQ